jgi:hypothetical protein
VDAIGMLREQPGCRYDLIERARELLVWRYDWSVFGACPDSIHEKAIARSCV